MPSPKLRVDGVAIDPVRPELNFASGNAITITKTDAAGAAVLTFDVTGATTGTTVTGSTAVHTPILDAAAATALAVGPTTATSVDLAGASILTNIKGDALLAAGKVLGFGAPQALTGVGAANVTSLVTNFTSNGSAQAISLADGTRAGQLKIVHHTVDGGSGVLTPTTAGNFATFTLTAVHDACLLQWSGTAWNICLNVGGTVG